MVFITHDRSNNWRERSVLTHRLDEGCLYNLDFKLDDINLDKFPMTAFARVWKTRYAP
jgi:hypothetical protein